MPNPLPESSASTETSRTRSLDASPAEPEPLATIVSRALAGDEAAFECLHDRLGGGLRRFLAERTGTRGASAVDELAQEAWVVAWRALRDRRYDPRRAAFTTFLYAIAHRVFLRYVREIRRDPTAIAAVTGPTSESDPRVEDPAESLDHSERLDALAAWLDRARRRGELSADELALIDGISAGEPERTMAQRLGVSPSTVHERKKQLMNKLRRGLAAEEQTRGGRRGDSPEQRPGRRQ